MCFVCVSNWLVDLVLWGFFCFFSVVWFCGSFLFLSFFVCLVGFFCFWFLVWFGVVSLVFLVFNLQKPAFNLTLPSFFSLLLCSSGTCNVHSNQCDRQCECELFITSEEAMAAPHIVVLVSRTQGTVVLSTYLYSGCKKGDKTRNISHTYFSASCSTMALLIRPHCIRLLIPVLVLLLVRILFYIALRTFVSELLSDKMRCFSSTGFKTAICKA